MSDTQPEFDPEYINQLLKVNADRIRELERALLEAQKAMTMLAAALASVAVELPEPMNEAHWQEMNRAARPAK